MMTMPHDEDFAKARAAFERHGDAVERVNVSGPCRIYLVDGYPTTMTEIEIIRAARREGII